MLNIELAVLQTMDQYDWWTVDEISNKTRIQEEAAEQVLKELNENGIVESRKTTFGSESGLDVIEWRSHDRSLENYLKQIVPDA